MLTDVQKAINFPWTSFKIENQQPVENDKCFYQCFHLETTV